MYIQGTTIVHTCIFKSQLIYIGILKVYTTTNGFAMLFYVHAALEHVQAMYEIGTYIKFTNLPVFVHISWMQKVGNIRNRTHDLWHGIQPP